MPLFLLVAVLLKLTSRGPVFYLQERAGKRGRPFKIVKFRSMAVNTGPPGPAITSAGDPRVTRLGRLIRSLKVDELPQLWNVLKGEMSLVGPRPEVPRYVRGYNTTQKRVLAVRPGITDLASITYCREEHLLAQNPDPEKFYRETVLPRKLALNLEYLERISLARDLGLILRTAKMLLFSVL